MPCPYTSKAQTAGETPALRNRLQLLPGSMKLNRPLQRQQQRQSQKRRQRRPAKGGRYKIYGGARLSVTQQIAGYYQALHFAGAFVDC
jgi:hypothetical protein